MLLRDLIQSLLSLISLCFPTAHMWVFTDYITLLDFNRTVFVLIFITLHMCVVIINFSAISIHYWIQHETRKLNLISGENY